jgi:hypothetical protein
MSIPHDPEYYRHRADELRLAATAPLSPEDRDTLRFFADQFDTLADDAESEGRTEPPDK